MTIETSNVHFGSGSGSGGALPTLPFRMIVIGDFSRVGLDLGEDAPAQLHRVDKDNFDAVLADMTPAVMFEVPNMLLHGGQEILANLQFKSVKDFDGAAVAGQIPALAELLKARDQIVESAGAGASASTLAARAREIMGASPLTQDLVQAIESSGGGGAAAPASAASAAPAPSESKAAPTPTGGGLDAILDMVDTGEEAVHAAKKSAAQSAIGSAISSIARSGGSAKAPTKGAQTAQQALDGWFAARIGRQLDPILHHPEFQSMESAWRGLRFLVSRVDFRKDIVIQILAARKKDLRKVAFNQVLQEEYESPGEIPLSAILVDCAFENNAPDHELMQELAVKAELNQAPAIAQTAPEFFGRKTLQGLGQSGSLNELLGGAQFTKWRGLRDKDEMRWATLCVNRFLLRAPARDSVLGKSYPESVDEAKGTGLLWGSAIWALGVCMARSFAEKGWAHEISGPRGGGLVDSLHLRACELRPGKTVDTPLETPLTEMNVQDIASQGLAPLQGSEGSDNAFFTYLPSVSAPKKYATSKATQEAAMHAILPYQLFAGRMSQWLTRLIGEACGAGSAEGIQKFLEAQLRGVLTRPGDKPESVGVRVEVSDHDKDPSRFQVCFDLQPPFKFYNLTPRLLLAVAISK